MTLRENPLLQRIYRANASLPAWVALGPGDDMAQLDLDLPRLLVAADQVIDGVHFRLHETPLESVARKALNRNLSDVAAMAVRPVASLATAALPRGMSQDSADALFDALREVAQRAEAPLIGGDLAVYDGPLQLSVTVLARPWDDCEPVTRRGARPGDGIWVTGQLGGSFETGHHLRFTPRVAEAHRLASRPTTRPRAMIDLSDGLAQDLPRLVPHAEIHADRLPLREGWTEAIDAEGWRHALGDGEDYELLFILDAEARPPAELSGVALTRIGTVTADGGQVVIDPAGRRRPLAEVARGWEHRG